MKKIFTKLIGVTLGLAMAVGVGVGVAANNRKATMLDAAAGDTFERITSAGDIGNGDVIIIVSQDKTKAMSTTQNNNNRGYVNVTSTEDVITIPNNSTIQELTVYAGSTNGQFGFYTGSGFLYGYNGQNYLRTSTDNTPAASDVTGTSAWTISATNAGVFSITNVSAQKSSNYVYIAWNSQNSIFSAYGTGQQKPYIYKKVVNSSQEVDTVTASIKNGTYYAGSKLLASDFNVTVTWTGGKADTNPDSGFTWTVGGVLNGTLALGNNSVVVTYESVNSAAFNVAAVEDTRWDTEFSTTKVANIEIQPDVDTAEKYYVVARITSITNTQFGNGNAVDEDGTEFAIYGMYNFNGKLRYDSMLSEQKPVANDVAVLYGVFTDYNGPEIKNAWVVQLNGNVFEAPALTGVTLNKTTLELKKDAQFTLIASPSPVDAELGSVTWTSSNAEIASVDSNGQVTGVKDGSATITATAGGFTATCSVTVVLSASLDLSTDTTTSASSSLLSWEVSNKFSMRVDKFNASTDANNYYPGKAGQSYTSTRFYKNSKLTLTPSPKAVAVKAEFLATTEGYATKFAASVFTNADAEVSASNSKLVIVTFVDGLKPFNAVINDTCGFTSVDLVYTSATARQEVERGCLTEPLLAYHYSKDGENPFVYSNVVLRFGGFISVALWTKLAEECDIESFGIMYAETDDLSGDTIRQKYTAALTAASGDIDAAIASLSPVVGNSEVELTQSKTHPGLATASQKTDLGIDSGDYYMWNHREIIGDGELETWFSAVAYIRIDNEMVFLQENSKSAKQVALDLLDNNIYEDDAFGGSLYALAHLND